MTVEQIAAAYYDAWRDEQGDMSSVPLGDDCQFSGPVASFDSAAGYREMSAQAGQAVTSFEVRRQFIDGGTVCSIIDWEMAIPAFGADGSDEPLGDGVRLRRPHRRPDDPESVRAEHLVEGAGVLAVAVADQEAHALIRQIQPDVARLLGHPRAGGVRRAAGEPDAAACMRDEEEHVVPA
jgi:hypothetical protein